MKGKIISFDGGEDGNGLWYVCQAPSIKYSQAKEDALVFNVESVFLESVRILGKLTNPSDVMTITTIEE